MQRATASQVACAYNQECTCPPTQSSLTEEDIVWGHLLDWWKDRDDIEQDWEKHFQLTCHCDSATRVTTVCFVFPLNVSVFSPCRIPNQGKFGGRKRESRNECEARVWEGRGEGHNSAPAVGEAVKTWADAPLLLRRIGDSVTSSYWLWVFFWEMLCTIIFLL